MKGQFIKFIFLIALFSFSVSAITINEGQTVIVEDITNTDRNLKLISVQNEESATIQIDGRSFEIQEGKNYELNNVEIFVNDILFRNIPNSESKIIINEFRTLDEERAKAAYFIAVNENNRELSFSLDIVSPTESDITVNGETKRVKEGDYIAFQGLEFFVQDILWIDISAGEGTIILGFSAGDVVSAETPKRAASGECKDDDGNNFYKKDKASGKYWDEFAGYGNYEKTDYCWGRSSAQPTATGDYVVDFQCVLDIRTNETIMVGSIFRCPNRCVDGACTGQEQKRQEEIEEDEVFSLDEVEEKQFICGGCKVADKCYPFGYRKENTHCSDSGNFMSQKESDKFCENNFECQSNVCVSGQCVSDSLIKRILEWFRQFFS